MALPAGSETVEAPVEIQHAGGPFPGSGFEVIYSLWMIPLLALLLAAGWLAWPRRRR